MGRISFKATQGVYLTYRNYPYKTPQVFGEFIDNSIQSFENNKNLLTVADSNYRLKVEIDFEWALDSDNVVKAKKITIRDNAAGMTEQQFEEAFDLANPRINRSGMNEYGVGMKAAASWLGNNWHVETTSITDNVTRVIDVDLLKITNENIEELESKDTINTGSTQHGTLFIIDGLWPENAIKKDDVKELIKSIASIYRYFIRRKEIQISIGEDILTFEDYEVLEAPSYKDLNGPDIKWTCPVATDDRRGHGISGFVALLKNTADEKRGVVIMRNHRVVMGFDPKDRTIGKDFIGQIGSNKYRRVFGELEITGFKVAFGKNQVNDPGLLEALCKQAAGKLIVKDTNLLTQCDKYRKAKKPSPTPPTPVPPGSTPVSTPIPPVTPTRPTVVPPAPQPTVPTPPVPPPEVPVTGISMTTGKFKLNGETYQFVMRHGTESSEMFWNDLSQQSSNVLLCKVNINHPFFKSFGKPDKQLIAVMKALSIAKFKSSVIGLGSAINMMNEFNQIINTQEAQDSDD